MEKKSTSIPELWGGIECSFNRVKGKYFDQVKLSGHDDRIEEDIRMFSALGIRKMRYPIIWEKLQPLSGTEIDWRSTDRALHCLREANIEPIVGLVHHGSGPRYALIDTVDFAPALSQFARQVAQRYPWVKFYTPVNEPLTTSRFSSLYGVWYPHKRNDRSFVRTLINELRGVVLSMQEIRKINPEARLVQTEDLAKIYSTPFLKYQADFENERRWLTYDILCGFLKPGHRLWRYFRYYAASEEDLLFFVCNICPPDILGVDYYPTSERYLDENLDKYPVEKHGHNHRHHYADVEAIRVRLDQPSGINVVLGEVWERYRIPIAVTEVHINCDYDNQIRWFGHIYDACINMNKEGADIRAITTWAMLGSYGWNRLLTEPQGDYESGAFDVSSGFPVATPVAKYLSELSGGSAERHPALAERGWWQEEDRFLFERDSPGDLVSRDHPVLKEDCVEG